MADPLDLNALGKLAAGFPGTFRFAAFLDGSEVLELLAPGADPADPGQDEVSEVAEGIERHVAEPIAALLNAVPRLILELAAARERITTLEAELGQVRDRGSVGGG